jgi:hypothetical protein
MKLKNILDFYLKTSIHIGFAVLSLVHITKIYLQLQLDNSINYFIFFGTVLGYNFLKYMEVFYLKKFTVKHNLDIILVSFLAFLGTVFSFFQMQNEIQFAFLKIGILVFLYPFLRNYGFLKMFLVAFCVSIITVNIPCLYLKSLHINFYIILIQRFLIIISLLIPFEILDSKTDKNHLKTIPLSFGINLTKLFGIVLISLFLALDFIYFQLQKFVIDLTIALLTALFIVFSNINRNKYYTSFWVESVPIFWFLVATAIFSV